MGSDYEDSETEEGESLLEGEMEEGEYEEEEDEEEEEEESELERNEEGKDGEIKEEKFRKVKKKRNQTPEPIFKFDPARFLARVLKSLEETGKIPEREVISKPNLDEPKIEVK